MCGIVGYIGSRPAREIIINGLKKLEYRGYDSAGMALVNGETKIFKCAGRVQDLEDMVKDSSFNGTTGMGHTRWATHGEPNELNAHPQESFKKNFVVVHNGIIENYSVLKKHLETRGVGWFPSVPGNVQIPSPKLLVRSLEDQRARPRRQSRVCRSGYQSP